MEKKIEKLENELRLLNKELKEVKQFLEVKKDKLIKGRWYNWNGNLLVYNDDNVTYGFCNGNFMSRLTFIKERAFTAKLATKQEVEEVLIAEAKKIGYAEGVLINCLKDQSSDCTGRNIGVNIIFDYKTNELRVSGCGKIPIYYFCIFKDGNWAEIIEQPNEIIDWSKSQIVQSKNNPNVFILTNGIELDDHFSGVRIHHKTISRFNSGYYLKSFFQAFKGQITIEQ